MVMMICLCFVMETHSPLPRNLTPYEAALLQARPLTPKTSQALPAGTVWCPAEYDPTDGILLSYLGPTSWLEILAQMAAAITTTGEARVFVMVEDQTDAADAIERFANRGADPARVFPQVAPLDTLWIRDYGPRIVYEQGCRVIIDHTYNRPRPNDDDLPVLFGQQRGHRVYDLPLIHGGGNFHLFSLGSSAPVGFGFATELIMDENPTLSANEIMALWRDAQNLETNITSAFPQWIDSTQHIDMWMIPISPEGVLVSDWPQDVGSTQDILCDEFSQQMEQSGKTVWRLPARSLGGVHYTYTNAVICNDLILVPSFSNFQMQTHNAQAVAIWQQANPEKTMVTVDCEDLVSAAGVMHCIAMHYPAFLGAEHPLVASEHLVIQTPLLAGNVQTIEYLSDDAEGIAELSLWFSVDGGESFSPTGHASTSPFGQFTWEPPSVWSDQTMLRLLAENTRGTFAHLDSNVFALRFLRTCPADLFPFPTGDGVVDWDDFAHLVSKWRHPSSFEDIFPFDSPALFGDGSVNLLDLLWLLSQQGMCLDP